VEGKIHPSPSLILLPLGGGGNSGNSSQILPLLMGGGGYRWGKENI